MTRRQYWDDSANETLIRSEFSRSGIDFIDGKKNFTIRCVNPSCPSLDDYDKKKLNITKDGAKYHCWVCDTSGSWNTLAGLLGLRQLNGEFRGESVESAAKNKSVQIKVSKKSAEERPGTLPAGLYDLSTYVTDSWRGLSYEFLNKLGAKFWHHRPYQDNDYYIPRIFLPFYQRGELVGYTGRRTDKSDKIKYFHAPWMQSSRVLYPYDFVAALGTDRVVLVEGQIDALALLHSGIPALCIAGVSAWSNYKLNLLTHLGIRKVFLCFDGDAAGRTCATNVQDGTDTYTGLNPVVSYGVRNPTHFGSVTNIVLPEGDDPGSLQADQLQWLKELVSG